VKDVKTMVELLSTIGSGIKLDKKRKKIEIDTKNPKYLQTIRGAGYVLLIE